ncbi:unnamed protein product [Tetraodon nigroviridis]|uniref:(spotted green pufferfish) hypothetical protein n=1 Tax=Tetraodon nigroviridis TaxID=99883 RepID=Q4RXB8_TETNG|nr:unnamed protein product [Tetraodon nigroviridis]
MEMLSFNKLRASEGSIEGDSRLLGPRCRYAIGRILSEGEDEADEKLLQRCQGLGFNVFSFPEAAHVVTTSLHHRTVFSVPVGVGRVYPKLERYIKTIDRFQLLWGFFFLRGAGMLHTFGDPEVYFKHSGQAIRMDRARGGSHARWVC